MIESNHYTNDFFSGHADGAFSSAKVIVPIIANYLKPKSVVDIGCGVGNWLKAWNDIASVEDYLGVEGPYISRDLLKVPKEKVLLKDLKEPLQINRRFDLAMSLEVAEHLPTDYSENFVKILTSLSDYVLFSASIPGQDGTYHINEQIPEYWAKIFASEGYVAVDCVRDLIWNSKDVEWWYKQNIILYVKKEALMNSSQELQHSFKKTDPDNLLRIHPWIYFYNYEQVRKSKTLFGYLKWRLYPFKKSIKKMFK